MSKEFPGTTSGMHLVVPLNTEELKAIESGFDIFTWLRSDGISRIAIVILLHRCDETQPQTMHTVPCWIGEDAEWTWGYWTGTEWQEADGDIAIDIEPTYWVDLPIPPTP